MCPARSPEHAGIKDRTCAQLTERCLPFRWLRPPSAAIRRRRRDGGFPGPDQSRRFPPLSRPGPPQRRRSPCAAPSRVRPCVAQFLRLAPMLGPDLVNHDQRSVADRVEDRAAARPDQPGGRFPRRMRRGGRFPRLARCKARPDRAIHACSLRVCRRPIRLPAGPESGSLVPQLHELRQAHGLPPQVSTWRSPARASCRAPGRSRSRRSAARCKSSASAKWLALHDRPQGSAGSAGAVAQGGGNAGCPGQAQDGDDQVAFTYGQDISDREDRILLPAVEPLKGCANADYASLRGCGRH